MKTRLSLSLLFAVVTTAIPVAKAQSVEIHRVGTDTITGWTPVNGPAASVVLSDPQVTHAPYLQVGNSVIASDLPFPLRQDFSLRAKIFHADYQRFLWIGLLDETGKKGYGVGWDSSTATGWGGQGFLTVRRFDLTTPLDNWQINGSALGPAVASGHIVSQRPFLDLRLSWKKATGKLTLEIDGVQVAERNDTAFNSFSRLYFKGNGQVFLDDVSVEAGFDKDDHVRAQDMYNQRDLSLASRWTNLAGAADIVAEGDEYVVRVVQNGTRLEKPVADPGGVSAFPIVSLSYMARRTVASGNMGGYFMVDAAGVGYGFLTELADESLNRTTLKVVATSNAGQTYTTLAHKEFGGIAGQAFHRVAFTWDRSTGVLTGAVDDAVPQQIHGTLSPGAAPLTRCVLYGQFAATLRLDNLLVTRVPENALRVTSTSGYATTIAAANSAGVPIFFPSGIYAHSGNLTFNGISVIGAGPTTTFRATTPAYSALKFTGNKPSLTGVRLVCDSITSRLTTPESAKVYVHGAQNFTLAGNLVENSASGGFFIYSGATAGVVRGNIVRGTWADGIHMTQTSNNLVVLGNIVTDTADDFIAVVSYGSSLCSSIDVFHNFTKNQEWGRGLSVVGGNSITIAENDVISSSGAGILVASEGDPYYTASCHDNLITGNVIVAPSSNPSATHAGIHVVGRAGYPVVNTRIERNLIQDSLRGGVELGRDLQQTTLRGNLITGARGSGIRVSGATDTLLADNELEEIGKYGIEVFQSGTATAGYCQILGNHLSNIHKLGTEAYIDAIQVSPTSLSQTVIQGNHYTNPGGYPVERFIENHTVSSKSVVSGNTTDSGKSIWNNPNP